MPSVEQNKVKRSGIGLRACDRDRAFNGFTLFAPLGGSGPVRSATLSENTSRDTLSVPDGWAICSRRRSW